MDFVAHPTPFLNDTWALVQYERPPTVAQAETPQTMFSKPTGEFDVFKDVQTTGSTMLFTASSGRSASAPRSSVRPSLQQNDAINRIASQRIQLLAAKYASTESNAKELQARLEILSQRLLEKSPRVSPAQVDFVEGVSAQLDAHAAKRLERAQRLGLKLDRSKEVQAALKANARG